MRSGSCWPRFSAISAISATKKPVYSPRGRNFEISSGNSGFAESGPTRGRIRVWLYRSTPGISLGDTDSLARVR